MRVYKSRKVYPQTFQRGVGETQKQSYVWHLHQEGGEAKEKNNPHMCFEIRPGVAHGKITQYNIEAPFADFDAYILDRWEHCSCHPDIDGTRAYRTTIHMIDDDLANVYYTQRSTARWFSTGEKRMLYEKEHRHWPRRGKVVNSDIPGSTVGWDETHIPEPVLVLDLEVDTANTADGTIVRMDLWIEGHFPKHYLKSQLRS